FQSRDVRPKHVASMAAWECALVRLVDRFDVEAELAQIMYIAAPPRARMVNRRASTFACGHEREQSPCLTPSNGDHPAVIVAGADADRKRDRARHRSRSRPMPASSATTFARSAGTW